MNYYYVDFDLALDSWYVEPFSKPTERPLMVAEMDGSVLTFYTNTASCPQDAITQADECFANTFPDLYPTLKPTQLTRNPLRFKEECM